MKYTISPFTVALGLVACASTALPALAAPTGAITSHRIDFDTAYGNIITAEYTMSNIGPDSFDVRSRVTEFATDPDTGYDTTKRTATDAFGLGPNDTALGSFYVGGVTAIDGWTTHSKVDLFYEDTDVPWPYPEVNIATNSTSKVYVAP